MFTHLPPSIQHLLRFRTLNSFQNPIPSPLRSRFKMSTYIPPGWTPERLETATAADLQTLPEEVNRPSITLIFNSTLTFLSPLSSN